MKGILAYILLVFALTQNANAKASFNWSDRCIRAQEACMRLDYKEARRLLSEEKRLHPENLITLYMEGKVDFLQTFLIEDDSLINQLKKGNARRIEQLKKGNPNDPYQRLCIAELYLHQAAARIKAEEFFGAVYDTRKANSLLSDNRKAHPGFKPNLLGLGFIHCVTGSIPKNYQWIAGLLGFDGTVNGGLNELRLLLAASAENNSIRHLHDETLLCLTFLELALLPKSDNTTQLYRFWRVNALIQKPLLVYAKGSVHASAAENDSVLALIDKFNSATENKRFKYLHLMEGNARLFKLDPTAERCFLRFLDYNGGKTYRQSILQRLAWTRLIRNDKQGYRNYLNKMSTMTNAGHLTDEDRAAISEWKSGQEPNPTLLRARLLSDGGYYDEALRILAGQSPVAFPTFSDQLEYTYRLGRIYDKQGKSEQAIRLYESTLKNGADHPTYFAANSALHLGQLYESMREKAKARTYYQRTLELRNHEFQNSIDQKAKAGLSRLNE